MNPHHPAAILALSLLLPLAALAAEPGTGAAQAPTNSSTPAPVRMIHVSDLFRPHGDPDDHWDLACVYALAVRQKAQIAGILIDFPPDFRKADPDVLGVAQMNYLCGLAVPVMVGSPRTVAIDQAGKPENAAVLRGVKALIDMLRKSPGPVVISILGSSRDVAMAGKLEPELFAKKVAAVYLNAGSGTRDAEKAKKLEFNVKLDPAGYAGIFDLPCPVYWLPCFEVADQFQVGQWGSFYRFKQREIVPQLSKGAQNYFAYVFKHGRLETKHQPADGLRPDWLRYLEGPQDAALMERVNAMDRNMWCTAGFFHAAGLAVNADGSIVPVSEAKTPVCTFDPIKVNCTKEGITTWEPIEGGAAANNATGPRRFILNVRDRERYPTAMTTAMRDLLKSLP